jgi:hypothetical protein
MKASHPALDLYRDAVYDSPRLSVNDYQLKFGGLEFAQKELSMVRMLGASHETIADLASRIGTEGDADILRTFAHEGGVINPVFYPALARARAHTAGSDSLVRIAREAASERFSDDLTFRYAYLNDGAFSDAQAAQASLHTAASLTRFYAQRTFDEMDWLDEAWNPRSDRTANRTAAPAREFEDPEELFEWFKGLGRTLDR